MNPAMKLTIPSGVANCPVCNACSVENNPAIASASTLPSPKWKCGLAVFMEALIVSGVIVVIIPIVLFIVGL